MFYTKNACLILVGNCYLFFSLVKINSIYSTEYMQAYERILLNEFLRFILYSEHGPLNFDKRWPILFEKVLY
jgi:hypothetical protein